MTNTTAHMLHDQLLPALCRADCVYRTQRLQLLVLLCCCCCQLLLQCVKGLESLLLSLIRGGLRREEGNT